MEKTKKIKEKKYTNNYIYGFIFLLFSIILEVTNFMVLGLGFLPTNFGIEFSMILIITGFIFLIPTEPLKIILTSVLFGVQLIMNVANASLYMVMYDLITVDMIFTLGFETADAFEMNQLNLTSLIISLIVLALFVIAIILGNKFMPKFRLKNKKSAIPLLVMLIFIIEILSFSSLTAFRHTYFKNDNSENLIQNNSYLYSTLDTKFASLKKYGFWPFYLNNCKIFFNYDKTLNEKELEKLTTYVNEGDNFKYTNSTYKGEEVSGLLKGDNLIVVMMESIEWFAIDPINTPNLYNFINEDSVSFTNFCARNKTNLSEEITMLGSIVNEYSFTTINNNVGIEVENSLPNQFKDAGYESINYFHDYTGKMYDRDTLHKEFGFENVYTLEQCPIENKSKYFGDFVDDGNFIKAYKNEFMPTDKKFFSFFTTVTTHGPYETSNDRYTEYYNVFDENYKEYCKFVTDNNLNYLLPEIGTHEYSILKEYKSKAMAVDNAIKVITNYLKSTLDSNGKIMYDNTSIVLYADHNAYYSDLTYIVKDMGKYDNNKDLYNIPFSIYSNKLQNSKIDTFCNTYDIYPTICDLYGFTYNKSLTHGYSVFSKDIENSVFVSTMCGIFDNDFYTVTLDDIKAKDDTIETNSNLQKFKDNVNLFLKKQQYIEDYYRINYEKYILEN